MIFNFEPKFGDKNARSRIAGEIYAYLMTCIELSEKTGKPFEVKFSEKKISKSWRQLKGIHLLCTRLIPHLSKLHEADYSLHDVKDFVKREFGFMRPSSKFEAALMLKSIGINLTQKEKKEAFDFCKKIKQPRSFAEASKEEMINLITEIEVWAASHKWGDIYLEPEEMKALIKFYDKQKF